MENYPSTKAESLMNRSTDLDVPSFQENMGDVMRAVFRLYRDNFVPVLKIVAVVAIPLTVVQYALVELFQTYWVVGVSVISSPVGESLMSGALIYAVVRFLRTGTFPSLAESYGWGFECWGRVLLCSLLYALVVILGMVALIIPGVILSLMFALVIPVAVLEKTPTLESFERSNQLTKNYRWQIFFTYFLFGLIIIVISLITGFGFGRTTRTETSPLFAIAQGLISQLLGSASTVLTLFIYLGILKDLKQLPPPDHGDTSPLRADDWTRPAQVETGREF
jgi:hypothetical protein